MKQCSRCRIHKPLASFAHNRSGKDGRHTYCRACMKEYNVAYYLRTKDRHNPARAMRRREVRAGLQAKLVAYLLEHPCVDCGEADIVVLQFDHREGKMFNIADGIRRMMAWELILAEIAKCDVVCANDHQRRTARSRRWSKLLRQGAVSSVGRAADS